MGKKRIVIVLVLVAAGAALLAGLYVAASWLFSLETYRDRILAEVKNALHREVTYAEGRYSLVMGPAFQFTGVAIKERDGLSDFLTMERLTVKVALLPLLEKKVVLTALQLDGPCLSLVREEDGTFNASDLFPKGEAPAPVTFEQVRVQRGRIHFTDRRASPSGVPVVLEGWEMRLRPPAADRGGDLTLGGVIALGAHKAKCTVAGSMAAVPAGQSLDDAAWRVRIRASGLSLGAWRSYLAALPFREAGGAAELDIRLQGTAKAFEASGVATVRDLRLDWPQVWRAPLAPRRTALRFDVRKTATEVVFPRLELAVDSLSFLGRVAVRDYAGDDPWIEAGLTMEAAPLDRVAPWLPFGIMGEDTAHFIERSVQDGTFRLEECLLRGRLSRLDQMGRPGGEDVFRLRARVEQGVLFLGEDIPRVRGIRGVLELRDRDFVLQDMSGVFGDSLVQGTGRITEYGSDEPSAYPFQATVTVQPSTLAWLAGEDAVRDWQWSGVTALHLQGDGLLSAYRLSGEWDLSNGAYVVPEGFAKKAGEPNQLAFSAEIAGEDARFSSLRFSLPPFSLAAEGSWHFGESPRLDLRISTNRFALSALALRLPQFAAYNPRGWGQATVRVQGAGKTPMKLDWEGKASLEQAALRLDGPVAAIEDMHGTVAFRDRILSAVRLAGRMGTSTVFVQGQVTNFARPIWRATFSTPRLDLRDVGLVHPQGEAAFRDVEGTVAVDGGEIRLSSWRARIGEASTVQVSGLVRRHPGLEADLTVAGSRVDLEDLKRLGELAWAERAEAPRPARPAGEGPEMTARIQARIDGGQWNQTPYRNLSADLSLEKETLRLRNLSCDILGGKLHAQGESALGGPAPPRTQVRVRLAGASVESFLRAVDARDRLMTGALHLEGDFRLQGSTEADIRKGLQGTLKVRVTDGVIRRYSTLAKIFSVLNVSQLLKLQLPDLVQEGMPYQAITGDVVFGEGAAVTENLFVKSDAINLSVVGRADLVRELLDAAVGAQPLQTVDKLVGVIPIVGWILTGKDRSLVTVVFEVKGPWAEPEVRPIPVRTLTKGVLDILVRTLKLPAKLFTDTGEVILGR